MKTRGVTLVELLASIAILGVVVALSASVMIDGARLSREAEEIARTNESARAGMEPLLRDLKLAGMGAPGGIWVDRDGAPGRINPVIAVNGGTDGSDELWLVVPSRNVMGEPCVTRGAAVAVTAAGTGPLKVRCSSPSIQDGDLLLATNMTSAALLTGVTLEDLGATIRYAQETLSGFSDAPDLGGFQVGDRVFPVEIIHYYVGTAPEGRPALFRSKGAFVSAAAGALPFTDPGTDLQLVSRDIEDLQLSFGRGTPPSLTWQNGLGSDWVADARSVRVSVVTNSQRTFQDRQGGLRTDAHPMAVEDHAPDETVDGLRRSLYTRRIELVNLDLVNL